jgi:prepilin-type N-terminal cleavage/methylation domain-containing protein
MRSCERTRRAGFTLLEVMAAVAVVGIVYIVVAGSAMQGLRTEGDASRRLRASLLADRVLSELELQMARGSALPPGETETTEEEFTIVVEVSPFDIASVLPEQTKKERDPARSATSFQVLSPGVHGGVAALLSIAVRVAWIEGTSEQEVTRQSFAFDLGAAAPLLEQIPPPPEPSREEEE